MGTRGVQQVHAVLRNGLQSAMRGEVVVRNVAKLVQVKTPRCDVGRGLGVEEARTLLCHTRSDRVHALYVLAVYLGLRRGELVGLRWSNVDVDQAFLVVAHTLQRVEGESGQPSAGSGSGSHDRLRSEMAVRNGGQRRREYRSRRPDTWSGLRQRVGGQGRGRTADLPLFRRTLVPTELPAPCPTGGRVEHTWRPDQGRSPARAGTQKARTLRVTQSLDATGSWIPLSFEEQTFTLTKKSVTSVLGCTTSVIRPA